MKRYFYLFALCLMALSCTKDPVGPMEMLNLNESASISDELRNVLPSVIILHYGDTVSEGIMTDKHLNYTLYSIVNDESEADLQYTTTHGFNLLLKKSDDIGIVQGSRCLKFSISPKANVGTYIASMQFDGSEEWYPIFLSLRDSYESLTKSGEGSQTKMDPKERVANVLCCPVSFNGKNISYNGGNPWFNSRDLLKDFENGTSTESVVTVIDCPALYHYRASGFTRNESSNEVSFSLGGGGGFPAAGLAFLLSASMSETEQTTNSSEREWYESSQSMIAIEAFMKDTRIKKFPGQYLLRELNFELNGPTDSLIKSSNYPLTDEGTIKLIDDYGPILCCSGTFGAYGCCIYERDANVSTRSIKDDAELSASAHDAASPTGPTTLASALIKCLLGSSTPSHTVDLKSCYACSESEYHSATHDSLRVSYFGGNALTIKNMDDWVATDDPKNWNLISYTTGLSAGSRMSAKYITIYDMIVDHNCERAKLVKKMLWDNDTFLGINCPYLQAKKAKEADNKTVIADVQLVWQDYKDNPKSRILKDPNGKARLYHPLILNSHGGLMTDGKDGRHSLRGYGFQIGCDNDDDEKYFDFIAYADCDGEWHKKSLCLYYALDSWRNCSGIEDIVLVPGDYSLRKKQDEIAQKIKHPSGLINSLDPNALEGYQKRGDDISTIWKGGRKMMNTSLYVKYVPKSTKKLYGEDFPYITAIALVAGTMGERYDKWTPGTPFASSMGAEEVISDQGVTDDIFNYYWQIGDAENLYTSIPYNDRIYTISLGVNGGKDSKKSDGFLSSIEEYYGPLNTGNECFKLANGEKAYTNFPPALFYNPTLSLDDILSVEKKNGCIFLNYSTKRIDYEHRSPGVVAKMFPYSQGK